jgi:predicted  nucleic acid-binding Zn ribbon protein
MSWTSVGSSVGGGGWGCCTMLLKENSKQLPQSQLEDSDSHSVISSNGTESVKALQFCLKKYQRYFYIYQFSIYL